MFQRDKSPEKLDVLAPNIELHGNPSSFIIYASVRQAVLERQVKQVCRVTSINLVFLRLRQNSYSWLM